MLRLPGFVAPRPFAFLPLLVFLVPLFPGGALGKGGTNMHEGLPVSRAGVPTPSLPPPSELLSGCGHGRYRDAATHRCRGPADIGN